MMKLKARTKELIALGWQKIKSNKELRKDLTQDAVFLLGIIMLFAGCSLVHCSLGLITVGSLLVFLVVRGASN